MLSTHLVVLARLREEALSVRKSLGPQSLLNTLTLSLSATTGSWLSAGHGLVGPGLLGMDGLTADEDFGEGRGLAVGILHQHGVGG